MTLLTFCCGLYQGIYKTTQATELLYVLFYLLPLYIYNYIYI